MRILLIRPPYRYVKGASRPAVSLPLGLLYIAGVLEKNSFEVQIYDALFSSAVPSGREEGTECLLGDTFVEIERKIKEISPDIVGISDLFTVQADNAVKLAELVKKINTKTSPSPL